MAAGSFLCAGVSFWCVEVFECMRGGDVRPQAIAFWKRDFFTFSSVSAMALCGVEVRREEKSGCFNGVSRVELMTTMRWWTRTPALPLFTPFPESLYSGTLPKGEASFMLEGGRKHSIGELPPLSLGYPSIVEQIKHHPQPYLSFYEVLGRPSGNTPRSDFINTTLQPTHRGP